ncbi:MAG TPA: molybdopterin dinucleotide binding domain-containing protein, partial [Fibrobacteria bacterium]|nr:molybdopterin dinucleotide binding domain-containing protein [Fibrobacteria bacterium]
EDARIQQKPGLAYDQILEGVMEGKIKGLWVIATNPAHSWVNQDSFRRAAEKLEFLVVQDMFPDTETARLAHLVLPSACWGEKEGTVINSERRIGLFKQVSPAPGKALADFYILKLLAEYWGCGHLFREVDTPEQAFRKMAELSKGRPCDFSGIADYRAIDREGGIQWPFPASAAGTSPERERRLFADGRFHHPDGKARFLFSPPRPIPEPVTHEFPFALLTGRGTSAQWHTNTRTGRSQVLRKLHPADPQLEIHPDDARRLGLSPGDWVTVRSLRGAARARALPASTVQPGQVFLAMHDAEVNRLTCPAFDPHSRQPSYKHAAVRVEKGTAP